MAPTLRNRNIEADNPVDPVNPVDPATTTAALTEDSLPPPVDPEDALSSSEEQTDTVSPTTATATAIQSTSRPSTMSGTATAATAVSPGPSTSSETSGIIPPPRSTINTGVNAFNSSSNDNQWKMTETEKLSEGSGRYFGWKALTSMYLSSTTLISLVNGTEPCPDPTTSLPEEIIAWTH